VLAFKAEALAARGVRPTVRYQAVPIDLRSDWPTALRENGFDPSSPAAWSAEGLLPYLPATGQDLLFERIDQLSSRDSRIAVEALSPSSFDPEYLERHRQYFRGNGPDIPDLWFVEERADLKTWLAGRGWAVTSIEAAKLMERHGRPPAPELADLAPRSVFIEGRLNVARALG
jgi:methyltransferase (TIGR00027 family)